MNLVIFTFFILGVFSHFWQLKTSKKIILHFAFWWFIASLKKRLTECQNDCLFNEL
jgi:hypothetical protein